MLSARGVEAESHLPFAVLSRLIGPVLHRMEVIPAPQRTALATALALHPGSAEPYAVYAATLSLLAAAAEERPLLGVVDDIHWMDEPSSAALWFAARRLNAEGVVLLLAARDDGPGRSLAVGEQPPLLVSGLDRAAAEQLVATIAPVPVAAEVTQRLV